MAISLESQSGFNYGYVVAFVSSVLFFINNVCVLSVMIPKSARTTKQKEWKWRNITNSLIHSVITGCGSCLCFWQSPAIREDLVSKSTTPARLLIALSVGYFVYDFIDMALNDRKSKSYELMVHHMLVISCFMLSMSTYNYTGYTLMALLVEVNSVFLHVRQLMIIQNVSRACTLYRLNSSLNLGTFVVFRILTMGWMTRWLVQHSDDLTVTAYRLAGLTLAVIMVMNIVLLLRILRSDYRQCPKQASEPENIKAR